MISASLILNQGPAPVCTHQPVLGRVLQPIHKIGLWFDHTKSWSNVKLITQTRSKSVSNSLRSLRLPLGLPLRSLFGGGFLWSLGRPWTAAPSCEGQHWASTLSGWM